MPEQELEIYRRSVLDKLKTLFDSIPNTKDNATVMIPVEVHLGVVDFEL